MDCFICVKLIQKFEILTVKSYSYKIASSCKVGSALAERGETQSDLAPSGPKW